MHRDQLFEIFVLLDRLFDRRVLHELRGELRRVHRRQRILVLELRGEQLQERVVVVAERRAAAGGRALGGGRAGVGGGLGG
jgi:hypothetical protein